MPDRDSGGWRSAQVSSVGACCQSVITFGGRVFGFSSRALGVAVAPTMAPVDSAEIVLAQHCGQDAERLRSLSRKAQACSKSLRPKLRCSGPNPIISRS